MKNPVSGVLDPCFATKRYAGVAGLVLALLSIAAFTAPKAAFAVAPTVSWTSHFSGSYNALTPIDIEVDSGGNVFVSANDTVIKMDPGGGVIGSGALPAGSRIVDMDQDGSGNIYVAASLVGGGPTGNDIMVARLDSNANVLWTRTYNGPGSVNDTPAEVAVDGLGNVYVVGTENDGSGASQNFITLKYDSTGTQLWARHYNGPANGADRAAQIEIDGTGNAYIGGTAYNNGNDLALVKYDAAGNLLYSQTYSGPAPGGNDSLEAIDLDGFGNVILGGAGDDGQGLLVKYDQVGARLWVVRTGFLGVTDVFARTTGAIFVDCGEFGFEKYSAGGDLIWSVYPGWILEAVPLQHAMAVDAFENVYQGGSENVTGDMGFVDRAYLTLRYGFDGTNNWSKLYQGSGVTTATVTDEAMAVTADDQGNVYVSGYTSGGSALTTIKYAQGGPDPLTTALYADPQYTLSPFDWYNTRPWITLESNMPATIHYQWDSTSGPWATYGSRLLGAEGNHTLYYYSQGGSTEPVKSRQIKVDTQAPVAGTLTGTALSGSQIRLDWTAVTDAPGGVYRYNIHNADTGAYLGGTFSNVFSFQVNYLNPGSTYRYYVIVQDKAFNYSAPSNTVAVKTGFTAGTLAGAGVSPVSVTPTSDVTITFSDILSNGVTTVFEDPSSVPGPPTGFRFGGVTYDIQTTAQYTAPIQISIKYNPADIPVAEDDLRLLHYENGAWKDVTLNVDTANHIIVGRADSLSPFGMGGPDPETGRDSTAPVVLGFLALALGGILVSGRPLNFKD